MQRNEPKNRDIIVSDFNEIELIIYSSRGVINDDCGRSARETKSVTAHRRKFDVQKCLLIFLIYFAAYGYAQAE